MYAHNLDEKLSHNVRTLVAVGIVAATAVGGIIFMMQSFAATPYVASEVEAGTNNGVTLVTDAAASGGNAIGFAGRSSGGSCPVAKRSVTTADVSAQKNSGYPAGTQLFVPGGPDPWGGCFPNADNTGVPAGTVLSSYTGSCTISTANLVIDAKIMNCDISIKAANVTIKNSKISAGNIWIDSGSLTLTDSDVDLGNDKNAEGLRGSNFTIRRADMYGGKRQVWCISTCTLEDSYLHDQLKDPSGVTHESAVRVEQYTTLRHNSLLCNAPDYPPDAGCSANQTGYPDFATVHDNTLEKNYYLATSGGYCSYGGASNGKPYSSNAQNATNIKSLNNVFQRGTKPNDRSSIPLTDKRRYTCGGYGVTTAYASSKPGFQFTGNMWDDGLTFASDTSYPYGGFTE